MGGGNSKENGKSLEEEDGSDFIDIEQENGSDELKVPAEEDNYPLAPSEQPLQNGFVHNNRPPVSHVKQINRKTSLVSSGGSTITSRRSLNTPRRGPTINYASAIATALLNVTHKAETYETLMKDLTSGLTSDKEKVYAITLWLSQQDIETGKFQKFKPDTPRGYMHLIQNGRGTFPSFFAQLCRKAGIPCVIVSGYSKSASYDVGEMNDYIMKQNTNAWNVVYADKAWHIVHPYWVCRGLVGHRLGGYVKIEKGGQAVMQKETASEGQLTKCFNKYYIFTDPYEFVYRNIPVDEQSKWQLLPQPLTFEEYKHKPYVRPEFFKQKLKLTSEEDCLLIAQNGICNIDIQIPPGESETVNFTYELDMKIEDFSAGIGSQVGLQEGNEGNNNTTNDGTNTGNDGTNDQGTFQNTSTTNDENQNGGDSQNNNVTTAVEDENNNIRANISRYVVMMRSGIKQENLSFEIRLPKEGTYKISIFSGRDDDWGDDPPLSSSFRLVCNNLEKDCVPEMVPIDPGIVGWGPGPKSVKSGLLMPSYDRGKIEVNVQEEVFIQFQVVTQRAVTVSMVHNTLSSDELKQYYSYNESHSEFSDRRELTIKACVPNKDEYALRIGTFEDRNRGNPDYVCNYLLSTKKDLTRREGPLVKEARKQVKHAIISQDLEEINYVLARAEKFHLTPDDEDDVRQLKRRRDFLEMKKMFRETFLRNNIDAGERMILRAENSEFSQVFKSDIANVRKMVKKLQNKNKWPHDIPEKNRFTLTEVSHMNAPPEKAQDVMKAICFMVWNIDDDYMDWTDTQAALKNKQKILNKMREMQEDESKLPNRKTMIKVKHKMESITEDTVRKIDNSLTPFYLWVKSIMERYDDIESKKSESKRSSIVPSLEIKQ